MDGTRYDWPFPPFLGSEEKRLAERKAYFFVSEPKLRKMLIAKYQECEKAVASYLDTEQDEAKAVVGEADAAREKARSLRVRWLVVACILAVVLVYLAHEIFGMWAAMAAAAVAIFVGRYLEQASNRRRGAEIRDALAAREKATAELKKRLESGPCRLKVILSCSPNWKRKRQSATRHMKSDCAISPHIRKGNLGQ